MQASQSPTPAATPFAVFRLTIPVLLAFFPLGVALGLVAKQFDIAWYYTIAMSVFMYAGSSEFLVVAMLAQGEPLAKLMLTGFLVNFRHIFYGLAVRHKIPAQGFLRYYTIATLSDETFALLASFSAEEARYSGLVAFLIHLYWFGSVACGVALSHSVQLEVEGIDFCLTALFVVLTIEQWHACKDYRPFVLALIAGTVAWLWAPEQMLLVSISASVLGLMACYLQTVRGRV